MTRLYVVIYGETTSPLGVLFKTYVNQGAPNYLLSFLPTTISKRKNLLFYSRKQCVSLLKSCGLKDDNAYLTKELDQWDVWNMDEDDRPHELRRMAKEWLDK